MATTIGFDVFYAQLAVFASSLLQPFNDWKDQHVAQGFSWRPGSVSSRSLVETGHHLVEVNVADHIGPVRPESVRVIEVPFDVPADGSIKMGSITETFPFSLPSGQYLLRCEFLRPANKLEERVSLTFAKKESAHFAVVLADANLSGDDKLLTTAEPALGGSTWQSSPA